jgi:hypothetical protein
VGVEGKTTKATNGDLRETKVCVWIVGNDGKDGKGGPEGTARWGKMEEIPGKWLERDIGCRD